MGRTIGPYRLLRRLEGSGAEVHLAARAGKGRFVLALFALGPESAAELEREVGRCNRLDHPTVMPIVELFEHEGEQVLVFEGVPGTSLARVTEHLGRQRTSLSDGAALQIGLELCRGLAVAHAARDESGKVSPLIHAHLVPEQIFLTWEGQVKILGLGLGTLFRLAAGLRPEDLVAQPFAPPEVRSRGVLTVRANTYAAAAILWSLLAGRKPSLELLPTLTKERPDVDHRLARLLTQALEPMLVKRTTTCLELASAIERSGAADPQDLFWQMQALEGLDGFGGATIGSESFPPAALSEVPPSSAQPLLSWPPDSEEFLNTGVHDLPEWTTQVTQQMSRDHMWSPKVPKAPPAPRIARPRQTTTEPSMAAVTDAEVPRTPVAIAVEVASPLPMAAEAPPDGSSEPAAAEAPPEGALEAAPEAPAPPEAPLVEALPPSRSGTPQPFVRGSIEPEPRPRLARVAIVSAIAAAIPSALVGWWQGSATPAADCPAALEPPPAELAVSKPPPSLEPTGVVPRPSVEPTVSSSSVPSAVADPAPTPGPGRTSLTIATTQPSPHLYIDGKHFGPVAPGMDVPCGVHNVRIGSDPLKRWYSKSQAFNLPCASELELMLEPWYVGPPVKPRR